MPFKNSWQYAVTLVCGHQLTVRQQPLNKKATFACPRQPRCGYNVRWKSVRDSQSGKVIVNDEV